MWDGVALPADDDIAGLSQIRQARGGLGVVGQRDQQAAQGQQGLSRTHEQRGKLGGGAQADGLGRADAGDLHAQTHRSVADGSAQALGGAGMLGRATQDDQDALRRGVALWMFCGAGRHAGLSDGRLGKRQKAIAVADQDQAGVIVLRAEQDAVARGGHQIQALCFGIGGA